MYAQRRTSKNSAASKENCKQNRPFVPVRAKASGKNVSGGKDLRGAKKKIVLKKKRYRQAGIPFPEIT
jgi:hypothetical protein